jgi:hypothetical protein
MKLSGKILASIAVIILTAQGCSTQEVKPDVAEPASEDKAALDMSKQEPPMVIRKGDHPLNLVRIMDGAVCKNDQQGAEGEFLLYADPADIDRIKKDKGEKVFSSFEQKIETFSANVFEKVINATTLTEDPFALGDYEANQKLAKQVADNFKTEVTDNIEKFQQETTLTIDVVAFPASFTFYHKGCDINKMNMPD